jgi:hypothetical protein
VTLLPEAAPPPPPKPAPKPVVVTRPVPVVVKTAARVERNCVTVLNGLRSAQECF